MGSGVVNDSDNVDDEELKDDSAPNDSGGGGGDDAQWASVREAVAQEAAARKFLAHPALAAALMATGGARLVVVHTYDLVPEP